MGALDGYNMPLYEENKRRFMQDNANPSGAPLGVDPKDRFITSGPAPASATWTPPMRSPLASHVRGAAIANLNPLAAPAPATGWSTNAFENGSPLPPSAPRAAAAPKPQRKAAARPARPALPVSYGNPPSDPPPGFGEEAAPAYAPMTQEVGDAQGIPARAAAAQGPDQYDPMARDGGIAFTSNPDGTVDRMIALRSRTPEENAQYAQVEKQRVAAYPEGALPSGRMKPGELGYGGSQQQWEDQQALQTFLGGGGMMSAKDRADALLRYQQNTETSRNNDLVHALGNRTAATGEYNADSSRITAQSGAMHNGALTDQIYAKLPGDIAQQGATLGETVAGTRQKNALATGTEINNQFLPATIGAENRYKNAEAGRAEETTRYIGPLAKSEIEYRGKQGDAIPDKAERYREMDATKRQAIITKMLSDKDAIAAFNAQFPGQEDKFTEYVYHVANGEIPEATYSPEKRIKHFFGKDEVKPKTTTGLSYRPAALATHPAISQYPDAKQAPDGNYYVQRNGQFFRVGA